MRELHKKIQQKIKQKYILLLFNIDEQIILKFLYIRLIHNSPQTIDNTIIKKKKKQWHNMLLAAHFLNKQQWQNKGLQNVQPFENKEQNCISLI